jgi:predicted MFS family arabinose efflux permease
VKPDPPAASAAQPPGVSSQASVRRHNYAVIQADSVAMGVVGASTPYMPVLLARLGATSTLVGLLTALPALAGVVLALPIGRWLQRKRNIVPWYSRSRLVAQMSYAVIGVAIVLASPERAVGAVLVIWALATVPLTVGLVAFPVVMDGASGPAGRYELLSRRWAIMGLATAVTVALAGQLLGLIAFPVNYGLLFAGFSVAGLFSFWFSRQIRVPDQVSAPSRPGASLRERVREFIALVRDERPLVAYEIRAFVFNASIGLAMPLIPLFYVREVHAPDAWIGIIVAGQAAGTLGGYLAARQVSRRRGSHWVLLPALLGSALVPLVLALLTNLSAVAALAVVSGVFTAGMNLALFDELMKRVPARHGVTFTSVDYTAQNVALMVAPIVGGLLAAEIGLRAALAVATAVGLFGFALFALNERAGLRQADAEKTRFER